MEKEKVFTPANLWENITRGEDGLPIFWKGLLSYFNNDCWENVYNGSKGYYNNVLYWSNFSFPLCLLGTEEEKIFFGVELEYNYLRDDLVSFTKSRRKRREENPMFYFKGDGSLLEGVEINTQPFSVRYYNAYGKQYIANLLGDVKKNGGEAESNCGIHIHISRTIWKEAIEKIINLVVGNQEKFEILAWREGNNYCEYRKEKWNKYCAVNDYKTSTIEMRVFSSSLVAEEVFGKIECAMALVYFAMNFEGENTFDNFSSYIEGMEGFTNFKKLLQLTKPKTNV